MALLGARWSIRPGTDVKLAGLGAKWFINQAQTSTIGALFLKIILGARVEAKKVLIIP